ncbi:Phage-related minor tail protein [Pseudomonas putida]|nr:Phage-related minor tail protein [Pseudomonas putida]CAB5693720.1 Phage-related minor tail protein [Pseudomonas putida]CAC9676219.1 Phage-related minor tail protein [Pseudomonas putida]CAC9685407.1 Phage-related minor tail protein [Pseudomonas putida]
MTQESRLAIVIDSRNARQQIDQLRTSLNSLGDAGGEATVNVRGLGTAARAAGGALAALGVGAVAREVLRMTDAFKNMQGSLALVSTSTANASESFQKLLAMANNTGSSLESTVSLYTRLANATRGAGYTQEQMLNVTDALNKAFVISGATMQEASNAAIQLSQGLASGTLRGEELNSVMEQGPRITRALADYLGVTNGEIRKLAAEGKITGDVVTNALLKSLTSLNAELAKMPRTFEQASQALKNNFLAAIGQINVDPVVSSVDALAKSLAQPEVVMGIQNIANALGSLVAVGGDGLKTVAENTDALMAITGAYATRVGTGLVVSLAAATKARYADLVATQQQVVAEKQAEVASTAAAAQAARKAVADETAAVAATQRSLAETAAARAAQANTIAQLQAVQQQLAADRALEAQRLQAQINDVGRQQSLTRLAEIRRAEAAITLQQAAAERALAQTAGQEVIIQGQLAAGQARLTTLREADTAAVVAQNAAQVRLNTAQSLGARASAGLMALAGGPVGLLTTAITVAAGAAIYFASSTDSATEALNDQNRTLEDSIANYRALGAEQQRLKSQEWLKIQESALGEASSALEKYRAVVVGGGLGSDELRSKFQEMFSEVKSGQRTLDSLTGWIVSNTSLSKSYQSSLVELAASHFSNTEKAERYAQLLGRTKTATDGAASSSASLASAQKASAAATAGGSQAWEKYIAQLTQTRDLVGANAAQEAVYTATKAGFNKEQTEYARLMGEQTELLKKYEEAVKAGNKADQDRLRSQLLVSIKSSEALKIQMEAQGKAMTKMAENAEESSKRQITAMQQAANFAVASAARMVSPLSAPQQNRQGASLLTFGQPQTYTATGSPSVKTPEQQLRDMLDRLDGNTETKPGKTGAGLSSKLNEAQTAFDNLYKAAQPAKFALQEYVERQSQLELLLSKGKITQQQYNEALAQSSSMYAEVVQGQDEHLARLKQINDQYVKGQSLAELYAQKAAATGIQGPAGQIAQAGIDASIKGQVFNGKPNTSQIDAVIGGAGSELMRMTQENEQLQAWYDQRIAMYQQYRKLEVENAAQYDETIRQLEKQRAEDTLNNERSMSVARLSLAEGMFGDLTSIVGAFAGQQSGAYKAMFAVQKAASIAQSIISIQTGIAMAAANPFPLNLAAMASVAAATASIVGNIQSVGLNLATGGYVRGPGTGTSDSIPVNLSNGEFVVNAAATKRNRALLEAINSNERVSVAGGGGSVISTQSSGGTQAPVAVQPNVTVNLIEDRSRAGTVDQRAGDDGQLQIDAFVADIWGGGERAQAIEAAYGLSRNPT